MYVIILYKSNKIHTCYTEKVPNNAFKVPENINLMVMLFQNTLLTFGGPRIIFMDLFLFKNDRFYSFFFGSSKTKNLLGVHDFA